MRRFKILSSVLMSILAVGVVTASAAVAESTPLPLIHTALPGEVYPINLSALAEQTAAGDIELSNANSSLPAEGVSILLVAKELTALGSATIDFTGIHTGAKKCSTAGDASGVVLVPSVEWHLVYTSLSPLSELETAMLFLFTPFVLTCEGGLETEVEGSFLGRVLDKPVASLENDSVDFEVHLHCSNLANGIQELSSYYNDKLELLENVLLHVDISGTGFANTCLEVKPTLLFQIETTSAGGNSALMFTLLL